MILLLLLLLSSGGYSAAAIADDDDIILTQHWQKLSDVHRKFRTHVQNSWPIPTEHWEKEEPRTRFCLAMFGIAHSQALSRCDNIPAHKKPFWFTKSKLLNMRQSSPMLAKIFEAQSNLSKLGFKRSNKPLYSHITQALKNALSLMLTLQKASKHTLTLWSPDTLQQHKPLPVVQIYFYQLCFQYTKATSDLFTKLPNNLWPQEAKASYCSRDIITTCSNYYSLSQKLLQGFEGILRLHDPYDDGFLTALPSTFATHQRPRGLFRSKSMNAGHTPAAEPSLKKSFNTLNLSPGGPIDAAQSLPDLTDALLTLEQALMTLVAPLPLWGKHDPTVDLDYSKTGKHPALIPWRSSTSLSSQHSNDEQSAIN